MAFAGKLAFGTIDSFLLWRLTGGKTHATDATQRNINRRDRPNRKKGYQKSRNDRRKNSGEPHSIQC
jgi:hypothetical protein